MSNFKIMREAFSKQPAFTIGDMGRLLGKKVSREYLSQLLHQLAKQKRIFRIRNGVYSFSDDSQMAGFAFRPFYYGLQDALSLHGLWEQETNPVVITARKVRSGLRKFFGSNFVVRRVSKKMLFGSEPMKYGEYWIPVSTIEKTLIDMVYFRQHFTQELKTEFRKRADRKKLADLLERCPAWVRERVSKIVRIG
ncbi:MAG: hypothetical protein AABX01_04610 [Candidatus Micrarchaeota archaeon]